MSGIWRSEEMQLLQLMIPSETAKDTMYALGDLGVLQFKDLHADTAPAQRAFAYQVKRCDELSRKARFLETEVLRGGLGVTPLEDGVSAKHIQLDDLENELEGLETELVTINAHDDNLKRSRNELQELLLVIKKAGAILQDARHNAEEDAFWAQQSAAPTGDSEAVVPNQAAYGAAAGDPVSSVAGTIVLDKVVQFQRMLLRVTRGNVLVTTVNAGTVVDPTTGEPQEKAVFLVFFPGQRAKAKVLKICEAFGANRYPLPEDRATQQGMAAQAETRLAELGSTIEAAGQQRKLLLSHCATNLGNWLQGVRMEKLVYHELNKCSSDVTTKVLLAQAWCPVVDRGEVVRVLSSSLTPFSDIVQAVAQPMPSSEMHPTYYRTNNFTTGFQSIIDAYGVARYREVNPTVFSIMTFPFLFAVMFGDLGHGTFMLAFGLFMVLYESKLMKRDLGDIFGMLFGGRYVILLMAIFSMFVGLIYNEFFSIPMTFFGDTRWKCLEDPSITDLRVCTDGAHKYTPYFDPDGGPYPFGVDPIWHGTKSELPFLNSLKMKMSIIIGVIQMDLGILMSLFNHLHFKDYLSIWCEFVPQIIFLNSIFGYLCFLMMYKWLIGGVTDLYHVLIYMFLDPTQPLDPTNPYTTLFQWQGAVQPWLLLAALVSVPWMLVPKPMILKRRYEAMQKQLAEGDGLHEPLLPDGTESSVPNGDHHDAGHAGGHGGGHGGEEDFNFGEIMVHQMIHTIEFVLGAVSNTASYLRLWALSLAHSQLSAVFYDRVMVLTISMGAESGPTPGVIIAMMIGFIVFACATLGVLMVMESLSAFLHALRLHWVEFMNKFYGGDGYAFTPFSFKLLEEQA